MVVLALLEELFVSNATLPEAVDSVMEKFPIEKFGGKSRMNYYT